jgi:hypothetical protein
MVKVVCSTSFRISTLTIVLSLALEMMCSVLFKKWHDTPFFAGEPSGYEFPQGSGRGG